VVSKGFREPDFAQVVTDRATSETIHRILEQDAEQAEHALDRRKQGVYGVCEGCGEKIDPDRLAILPEATRCMPCQSTWEQQRQ
jgi:DnaK suppressor protein